MQVLTKFYGRYVEEMCTFHAYIEVVIF